MPIAPSIYHSETFDRENSIVLQECPASWDELRIWFRQALQQQKKLAIAYTLPPSVPPQQIWQQLIGIAKYLTRTSKPVTRQQLHQKLGISDTSLRLGFNALKHLGFHITYRDRTFHITRQPETGNVKNMGNKEDKFLKPLFSSPSSQLARSAAQFLAAVSEEQFRRKYFCEVPLATIQSLARDTVLKERDSTEIPF